MGKFLKQQHLHKKQQFMENAALKLVLVNLPCKIGSKDECSSGIYAMRHLETYMGVSSEQWEDIMTQKNKDKCIKAMRIKYTHKIITSPTNQVRDKALQLIKEYTAKPPRLEDK